MTSPIAHLARFGCVTDGTQGGTSDYVGAVNGRVADTQYGEGLVQ